MTNKLTIEHIQNVIVDEEYIFNGTLTICILTLKNGFKVIGESAYLNADNYNEEIGKDIAHINAASKIWNLEGYLLTQKRYEEQKNAKG